MQPAGVRPTFSFFFLSQILRFGKLKSLDFITWGSLFFKHNPIGTLNFTQGIISESKHSLIRSLRDVKDAALFTQLLDRGRRKTNPRSSLNATGTGDPLSHPVLGLDNCPFPNIGPLA